MLERLNTKGLPRNNCKLYPVADMLVGRPKVGLPANTSDMREQQVLIVNWDAVNGDPEYGAHLALRWFEHRSSEILLWVRDGGILVIEGQAVLSVPCQQAYDALAGRGELAVCGPENPSNPLDQHKRCKGLCRKTKIARKSKVFELVAESISTNANPKPTYNTYFPTLTDKLFTTHLDGAEWSTMLYRGWFRRTASLKATHPWVSVIETADRPWLSNQSTMRVARIGKGAIFASTMFLATTAQERLVTAILKCAGNTEDLPSPSSLLDRVRKYWALLLTFAVILFTTTVTNILEPWVNQTSKMFEPFAPALDKDVLKGVVRVGIPAVGATLLEGTILLFARLNKWFSGVLGL